MLAWLLKVTVLIAGAVALLATHPDILITAVVCSALCSWGPSRKYLARTTKSAFTVTPAKK